MAWSGGKSPIVDGTVGFLLIGGEDLQIWEAREAIKDKTGIAIDETTFKNLYLAHQRFSEQFGLDNSKSFGNALAKFAKGLEKTPTDFVEAFRKDLENHTDGADPAVLHDVGPLQYISDLQSLLSRLGIPSTERLGEWRTLLQSRISEIAKIPTGDPASTSAYVEQYVGRLVGLAESDAGGKVASLSNSVNLILSEGRGALVGKILDTLREVRGTQLENSVYALMHIVAAQKSWDWQRIQLAIQVLHLVRALSQDSPKIFQDHILRLEIAYLGSFEPDAQRALVDRNLTILLDKLLQPHNALSADAFDKDEGAVKDMMLVSVFLFKLLERNELSSVAEKLLEVVGTRPLNDTRKRLMAEVLDFSDIKLDVKSQGPAARHEGMEMLQEIADMLLDIDPKVQRLLNEDPLRGVDDVAEEFMAVERLLVEYEEIKEKRNGGKGGSGGKQGPALPGGGTVPPESAPSAAPPAGQTKSASTLSSAKKACLADAAAQGPAQVGTPQAGFNGAPSFETGGITVFAQ